MSDSERSKQRRNFNEYRPSYFYKVASLESAGEIMIFYGNEVAKSTEYRPWLTMEEFLYSKMDNQRKIIEISKAESYSNYLRAGGKPLFKDKR